MINLENLIKNIRNVEVVFDDKDVSDSRTTNFYIKNLATGERIKIGYLLDKTDDYAEDVQDCLKMVLKMLQILTKDNKNDN